MVIRLDGCKNKELISGTLDSLTVVNFSLHLINTET